MSKPRLTRRSTTRTICSSVAFSSITMIIKPVGGGQWVVGSGFRTAHYPLPTAHCLLTTPIFFTRFNAFDPARLVNHALEHAADGFGVERACVRGGDVGDDLRLAFRRIDLQPQTFFDMTDLDSALRPFVEEPDQFEINLVNPDTPIVNRLFAAVLFGHNSCSVRRRARERAAA